MAKERKRVAKTIPLEWMPKDATNALCANPHYGHIPTGRRSPLNSRGRVEDYCERCQRHYFRDMTADEWRTFDDGMRRMVCA